MGTKGVLASAGVFVVGLALSGCESSRPYYEGPRSYSPPQMGSSFAQGNGGNVNSPPGGYYSSSGGYYNQPRSLPAGTTTNVTTLSSAKTEPAPERHATSTEGGSSLQLVSGVASTANGAAPMLTITLPAVKLLVPVNGLYSFTPPAGAAVAKAAQPEAAVVDHTPAPVSSAWPAESQPAHVALQAAPTTSLYTPPPAQPAAAMQAYSQPAPVTAPMATMPAYCPPTATPAPMAATPAPAMLPEPRLQYSEPTVSTPASALQSSAPIMPSPMPAPLSMQAMPASLPNIPDDGSQGSRASPPPPPPTWPRPAAVADDGVGADLSPPPALPSQRGQPSNRVPVSSSGQNPYFQ
jgi:hypothetical protein